MLFERIRRYRTDYLNLVTDLAKESIGAAREATRDEGPSNLATSRRRSSSFLVAEDALTGSRKDAADARFTHAVELGVAGLTGSAALILLFAFYLSRSIARPVREAATGATQLAGGDLSLRLSQSGPGEIGELTTAFNRMAESLQRARVELEEQNAQLRDSERLKSDLVNTVSHELRTPLSGVLGFTKLLLTREFDSETRRHYLGIVDAQARRLSQLIDDFLDVRAIEEGRFDPARDLVDLGTLLRDEATLYSLQSDRHELALDVPDTPLPVMGNADRLRQVIGNLLSNAIKYSPQGGLVQVTASDARRCGPIRGPRRGNRHPDGAAAKNLYKVLPRRCGRERNHRHRARPRGFTRHRRVARRPDRLHERRRRGNDVLRRAARRRRCRRKSATK